MKRLIILLISFTLSSCLSENDFVEYIPQRLDAVNKTKIYGTSHLSSAEMANIIQVLEYYNEDYRIKNNNVVLITKELNSNWELAWNYTTKSNDMEWLRNHKKTK